MEARNRPLKDWMTRIENGQLRLPRFQRFESWGSQQVTALLETVLGNLTAGALLTLEVGGGTSPFKYREIETAPAGPETINELLLDGQQRLTALWRTLGDTYEERTYYVALSDQSESGGPAVRSINRSTKDGKKYPLWADKPKELRERDLVPVRLLRPGNSGQTDLTSWLNEATDNSADEHLKQLNRITPLREAMANFNFPFLSLPVNTDRAAVLDVFVKTNTSAQPLTAFDIIVANVEAEIGQSLHDLVNTLNGKVPSLARYGDLRDTVLRSAALFQDRAPDRPGFMNVEWPKMIDDWERLVYGAEQTVRFLEDEGVYDAQRFPIITPLAALIVLWSQTEHLKPDEIGQTRTLLRKYLWRSFFTERYESSAHTHVIQDIRKLIALVRRAGTDLPPVFDEPLPTIDDLLEAGWPRKRDRLARAILLLSFKGDALDLADGSEIRADNIDQREYHHIFPKGFLIKNGIGAPSSDLALNCALITWRTNRAISDKDPVSYLKDRAEAHELGDEEVVHRIKTHAIPAEPLQASDYPGMLQARAALLHEGLQQLADGKPWRPKL